MKRRSGFSLIEVLIAISFVALAFIAILNLNSANIRTTTAATDQSIGTRLAREGIEAVRSIRFRGDSVVELNGQNLTWNDALSQIPGSGKVLALVYNTANPSGATWELRDSNAAAQSDVTGNPGFKRAVTIGPQDSGGLVNVKVEVCWGVSDFGQCFSDQNQGRKTFIITKMGPKTNLL